MVLGQNPLGCEGLMYEGSQPCPRGPGPFRDLGTPLKNDHLNRWLDFDWLFSFGQDARATKVHNTLNFDLLFLNLWNDMSKIVPCVRQNLWPIDSNVYFVGWPTLICISDPAHRLFQGAIDISQVPEVILPRRMVEIDY